MGGKISDVHNLKKRKVTVEIAQRWGKCIIGEGAIIFAEAEKILRKAEIAYLRGRQRTEIGVLGVVFFLIFFVVMIKIYPTIF